MLPCCERAISSAARWVAAAEPSAMPMAPSLPLFFCLPAMLLACSAAGVPASLAVFLGLTGSSMGVGGGGLPLVGGRVLLSGVSSGIFCVALLVAGVVGGDCRCGAMAQSSSSLSCSMLSPSSSRERRWARTSWVSSPSPLWLAACAAAAPRAAPPRNAAPLLEVDLAPLAYEMGASSSYSSSEGTAGPLKGGDPTDGDSVALRGVSAIEISWIAGWSSLAGGFGFGFGPTAPKSQCFFSAASPSLSDLV